MPSPVCATSAHQHSVLEETVQQLVHMNQNFCATIEQQQAQFNQLLRENKAPSKTKTPPIAGQDKQTGLQFWLDAIPHFDGKKHEDFFEWISKIEDATCQAASSVNDRHWTEYHIATLKARGSVFTHLKAKSEMTPWIKLKEGLQMEFSSLPTMIDVVCGLGPGGARPHNCHCLWHRGREQPRLGWTAAVESNSSVRFKHLLTHSCLKQ